MPKNVSLKYYLKIKILIYKKYILLWAQEKQNTIIRNALLL